MAGTLEDVAASQAGQRLGEGVKLGLGCGEAQHAVAAAGDEQGRLPDRLAAPRPAQLPVALEVAVPVQAAAKAGAGEFLGVVVEVGLAQPRRQGRRVDGIVEQPAADRPALLHERCGAHVRGEEVIGRSGNA